MELTIKQMESLIEKLGNGEANAEIKNQIIEINDTKKTQIVNELTRLITKFNAIVAQIQNNYELYAGKTIDDLGTKTINQINNAVNTIINPE